MKKKKTRFIMTALFLLVLAVCTAAMPAFAANDAPDVLAANESPAVLAAPADIASPVETEQELINRETVEAGTKNVKAIVSAALIAIVAAAGAIGMAIAIVKSVSAIARQPEAEGKIRTTLMLGLVFIETAIIYALIVAILVIFVL